MRLQRAGAALLVLCCLALGTAQAADAPATPSGDQILARAGAADGLRSFSVPVHFNVHLHKPIGFRAGMDGTAYFKAPAKSALVITKTPPLIGAFFRGQYNLDMVPQAWPAKYRVTSVRSTQFNGVAVYELVAKPKVDNGVDHVVFDVAQNGFTPLAAQWTYPDRSTIGLAVANARVESYELPQTETVNVAMPRYNLDATTTFGQYALNVPVADSVFVTK